MVKIFIKNLDHFPLINEHICDILHINVERNVFDMAQMKFDMNGNVYEESLVDSSSCTSDESVAAEPVTKVTKSKFKMIMSFVVGFVLGVGTLGAVFFGLAVSTINNFDVSPVSADTIYRLAEIQTLIDRHSIAEYTYDDLQEGILKGYVSGLNDKYAEYLTTDEWNELLEEESGEFCGIGVQIGLSNSQPLITDVFDNGGAYDAGVKVNDIITKVNGHSLEGMSLDDVVAEIRGEENTSVNITVLRGTSSLDFDIVRKVVQVQSVESKILDDNIGYIHVSQFIDNTDEQFIDTLSDFNDKQIKKLILDFRSNGGGNVDSCINMVDAFLDKDELIFELRGVEGDFDSNFRAIASSEKLYDGEVVILMDEYSASASELFIGILRDYDIATLVGTTSYGKGIVQTYYDVIEGSSSRPVTTMGLDDYSAEDGVLKITTAKYYLPKGDCIHEVGIDPDYFVEFDVKAYLKDETDNQLEKAIELLK